MTESNIPNFNVDQRSTHVIVKVDARLCDEQCQPQAVVDTGSTFGVACSHFYLPLIFPEKALVDGRARLDEKIDSSIKLQRDGRFFLVRIQKQLPGQVIAHLNSIQPSVFPLLEDDEEGQHLERLFGLKMLQRGVEAARNNGSARSYNQQSINADNNIPQASKIPKSANTKVHEWFDDAPTTPDERTKCKNAAMDAEDAHWDEGMYLDNFVDEEGEIEHLLRAPLQSLSSSDTSSNEKIISKGAESSTLRRDLSLLLIELLLAYAYESRTTLGEPTVESAWTVAVLSRSLVAGYLPSCKDGDTIESVLIGSIRRQLSYPLYRNWGLSLKVAGDVMLILRKQQTQAALISLRHLFQQTEDEAILNYSADIIDPLTQTSFDSNTLDSLADELAKTTKTITKAHVGGSWNIEELEQAAEEAIREGRGGYV